MYIYSDKLAQAQVAINCQYSVAQMCTREDTLAHYLGTSCHNSVIIGNISHCHSNYEDNYD